MGRASGSETVKTRVPQWQEDAAQAALAQANQVAGLRYTPYYGVDVAAQTPLQMAAMQGTNQAASAFGMPTTDFSMGMPATQTMGGVQGYSSGDLYDLALAELKKRNPEQFAALTAQFGPPTTPAMPAMPAQASPTPQQGGGGGNSNSRRMSAIASQQATMPRSGSTGAGGGIGSFVRDMFDGGGMGDSGDKFKGLGISNVLNTAGVKPLPPRTATPTPVARPATVVKPAPRPLSGRI